MYAMSLAHGDSNVQYRRKKVQSKPSWNHLGAIRNIKRSSNFKYKNIFLWSFQICKPSPNGTCKRSTHHRNPILVRLPFLSTKWLLPTKGFVLHILVDLCSSVSLIIRFLESISRVWIFSNLLGYVFLRAKHHETCRGRA